MCRHALGRQRSLSSRSPQLVRRRSRRRSSKGISSAAFLAATATRLTPGAKGQFDLRYVNPSANWRQYTKIIVDPVTFWGGDTTKVSTAEQQALTDYFFQVLREQLGQKFQLVDEPGPGVMRLQVALTDVEAATPGLRTISTIVPQARALNTLKFAATGTYAFIGGAQAEAKLTDALTGQLLAEVVDRRVGGGSVKAAAQWQWGDAENAKNAWATQVTERLYSWTSGAAAPS
ncbi:MAG: DUF3313 domain-containing protein [Candidatus Entotheonellia bacterium]